MIHFFCIFFVLISLCLFLFFGLEHLFSTRTTHAHTHMHTHTHTHSPVMYSYWQQLLVGHSCLIQTHTHTHKFICTNTGSVFVCVHTCMLYVVFIKVAQSIICHVLTYLCVDLWSCVCQLCAFALRAVMAAMRCWRVCACVMCVYVNVLYVKCRYMGAYGLMTDCRRTGQRRLQTGL